MTCPPATLKPNDPASALLRPDEVATRLGISLDTLKRWRHEGRGPPATYLTARTVRYRRVRLEEWMERRDTTTPETTNKENDQ